MDQKDVALVRELDCRCKPGAKCPKVQLFEDGSLLATDDEQGSTPVRFDPEQAQALRAWLNTDADPRPGT